MSTTKEKEIGDDYSSSLADLTVNSKPLINMLTILAEESIDHAAVIVQSVEKHLDKVHAEMKLPVLYLVDSIIKNVGGAYTQLFSQTIVSMFCKVFKQVEEKTRSQMFKLRETWHDVFPSIKLYQLDVKVNIIDPAWPIQVQPPQSNIHVNPIFFKKNATSNVISSGTSVSVEEEKMRNAVALKEQELLLLQKKKVELELEQAKKLLQQSSSQEKKGIQFSSTVMSNSLPSAVVAVPSKPKRPLSNMTTMKPTPIRIAPANPALVSQTSPRDPRRARHNNVHVTNSIESLPTQNIGAFDNKPFVKTDKNNRFIKSSEINSESSNKIDNPKLLPRHVKKDSKLIRNKISDANSKLSKSVSSKRSRSPNRHESENKIIDKKEKPSQSPDSSKSISSQKLPPIPKIRAKNTSESIDLSIHSASPPKRRKENSRSDRTKKSKSSSSERKHSRSPIESPKKIKRKPSKYESMDIDLIDSSSPPPSDVTTFKELKFSTKERNYIRRNREKSESPETIDVDLRSETAATSEKYAEPLSTAQDSVSNGVTRKDIDFRVIPKNDVESTNNNRKRSPADKRDAPTAKKNRTEKFDELFGNADVDLRKLPIVDNLTPPPSALILAKESSENIAITVNFEEKNGGWAKVKEIQSPQGAPMKSLPHLDIVKAKLAEATKGKDRLGRPFLYSSSGESHIDEQVLNFVDTDMRQLSVTDLDKDNLNETISSILSQAEEQFKNGIIDKQQYNTFLMQVMQLNETQKLKEAQQKESLEKSKRRKDWKQKQQNLPSTETIPVSDEDDGAYSPQSDESDVVSPQTNFGDIDERVAPPVVNPTPNVEGGKRPPLLPCPDIPYMDCDLRMYDKSDGFMPRGIDSRYPGRQMGPRMYKGWRGMRPDRGGYRPMPPRGLLPPPMMNARRMPMGGIRPPFEPRQQSPPFAPKGPFPGIKQMTCPVSPYINDGKASPPPLGAPSISRGFVPVDSKVIEYIEQDTMRTIHIDGVAREIRYYDNTAVVMLDWDDPREISFEAGQRRISFDDESFILNLNGDYTNVTIDGQSHRIRFGAPTRELFIDDYWFECFFGGPPMQIIVNSKVKHLKLEGPPPQVSIGKTKRTDLVAGKINLIIDATTMLPIFLDAKLQKFEIENISHTIRFVDSLQTVLINEKPFKVEFGGLPKPLFVGKRKHFVRFSVLPRDVKAGHIYIKNMEGKKPAILPTPTNDLSFISAMSTINSENPLTLSNNVLEPVHKTEIVQDNYNIGNSNVKGGLDMLASVMPSLMAPASQYGGYSVLESSSKKESEKGTSIPGLGQDMSVPPPNINSILQNVNVDDLFAKLVASGIVSTLPNVTTVQSQETVESASAPVASTKVSEKTIAKPSTHIVKPVDIMKSETLKVRQPGLISLLHTGMQCGGCGARFPPEHTVRYSQHLDWHFRQNRADRHSQRRPNSRRWYYDISDWIQYQEIEDLEEREKSWFEREQQAAEAAKSEEAAAVAARRETSSVPLPSDASPEKMRCYLCHDSFHQFYNHDIDEWHLKNAVEFEGNNYHPICLDDHKASLIAKEQEKPEEECKDESLIVLDKENNESTNLENEDSPMKDLDTTEPEIQDTSERDNESVVEVLSEEANTQESNTDEAPDVELVEEDDDDVVIKNEPIEQIIVDDVDTDEETENERRARDQEIPIDFANVKIKQEPIDPDDEPIITSEGVMTAQADTTHAAVLSSIDGNVQLEPTAQNLPNIPAGGIRINITKPLINLQLREKEVAPKPSEPIISDLCPPGEEVNTTYKLKPGLENVSFAVQPPAQKGSELSGLCSVM